MDNKLINIANDVYKVLSSTFQVEIFDDNGVRVFDPKDARNFYCKPNKILVSLKKDRNDRDTIDVLLSDMTDIKDFENEIGQRLRRIASRNNDTTYNIRKTGREIKSKTDVIRGVDMDNVTESMYGTTRSSYQKIGECKVIIRHSSRVNENKHGARSRHISSIFIETANGERFKVPYNNIHGSRALARHLSNGGKMIDSVGTKITNMMEHMHKIHEMIYEAKKISKTRTISENDKQLMKTMKKKYLNIRETLKRMSGKYGYHRISKNISESSQEMVEYDEYNTQNLNIPWDNKKEWATEILSFIDKKMQSNQIRKPEYQLSQSDALAMLNLSDEVRQEFFNTIQEYGLMENKKLGYVTSDKNTHPITKLLWNVGNLLSNPKKYNIDELSDEDFVKISRLIDKTTASEKVTRDELEMMKRLGKALNVEPWASDNNIDPYVFESYTTTNDKNITGGGMVDVLDQTIEDDAARQVQDMTSFARDTEQDGNYADVDDLFSSKLKENRLLESWFNNMSKVEFFNENDLNITNTNPVIEKTLPHNALHNLNLHVGNPLFDELIACYESQGILDTVVDMIEEESKLYEHVIRSRNNLNEYFQSDNIIDAYSKVSDLISTKKMGSDEAINMVVDELTKSGNVANNSGEELYNIIYQMLVKDGLIHYDAGNSFADDVMSTNDEIEQYKDEIESEKFYSDAQFNIEEMDETVKCSGVADSEMKNTKKRLDAEVSGPYVGEGNKKQRSWDDDEWGDDEEDYHNNKKKAIQLARRRKEKERNSFDQENQLDEYSKKQRSWDDDEWGNDDDTYDDSMKRQRRDARRNKEKFKMDFAGPQLDEYSKKQRSWDDDEWGDDEEDYHINKKKDIQQARRRKEKERDSFDESNIDSLSSRIIELAKYKI